MSNKLCNGYGPPPSPLSRALRCLNWQTEIVARSYNDPMRASTVCAMIFAAGLAAQVKNETQIRNDLTTALRTISGPDRDAKAKTDLLLADLSAVPEAMHQPSRATMATLARELVDRLSSRNLSRPVATQIATDIVVALRSAGLGTSTYRDSIARVEKVLSELGVPPAGVRSVAAKLRAAGDEARGPEDVPVIQDR